MNFIPITEVYNNFKSKENLKSLKEIKKDYNMSLQNEDDNAEYVEHIEKIKKKENIKLTYNIEEILQTQNPTNISENNNIYISPYYITEYDNEHNNCILYLTSLINNKIDFVNFKTQNINYNITLKSLEQSISSNLNINLFYKGFLVDENNYYFFYKIMLNDENIDCINCLIEKLMMSESKYYLSTITEIINQRKIYNYNIYSHISNLFINNHELCFLYENGLLVEAPDVLYNGNFSKTTLDTTYSNIATKGHDNYTNDIYIYLSSLKNVNKFQGNLVRCLVFLGKMCLVNKLKKLKDSEITNKNFNNYNTILYISRNRSIFIKENLYEIKELDNLNE